MPNDGNRIWADKENEIGISIHADIYPVLGLGSTGAGFDLAPVCTSGKIKGGQKNKPTKGGNQATNLYTATTDPSPSDMMWSLKPAAVCVNKRIGDFIRYQASLANRWEYYPPELNADWMRVNDFDNYKHNAPYPASMCSAGPAPESVSINQYGVPDTLFNLFSTDKISVYMEILESTGFFISELFQHRPNLRFVVEVYNTFTYNTDGETKTYWYDSPNTHLIAKYCFDKMSSISLSKTWNINLYDLMKAINVPVKSLGSTGYPATMVFGLQEADEQTTATTAVSGKDGGVAGTGIVIPGYRNVSGGQLYEYNFNIANEWDAEIEEFQYGFIQRGINNTSIQWKSSPATAEGLYEVYTNWADTDNQSLVKDGANLFLKVTIRNTSKVSASDSVGLDFVNNINADGIKLAVIRRNHPNRDVMPVRFFPTADYITYTGASSSVIEMSSFSVASGESKTVYLLVENFFTNNLGGLSEATENLYWNSARLVWTRFKGSSYPTESEFADSDNTLSWADGESTSYGLFDMGTYIET